MTVPSAANDSAVTGTAVPGLWRNRNFRWLWFGQAVSTLGDEVYDITMVLWVATVIARNEPWAPMAVAGLALAVLVPTLLFSLIGGVYADRWDRRRTMLAADAVRAVLTGCLCVLAVAGPALSRPVLLTAVYFLAGLTRIAALFFDPARYGLLAAVVDDADRERMGSITMATGSLAGIIGPSLAAALLFTVGVQWALLVNATSFAVSYASIVRVRPAPVTVSPADPPSPVDPLDPPEPLSLRHEVMVGIRFFAGSRTLRMLLATLIIITIGVDALNTLEVFFVTGNLHLPAQFYGVLATTMGVGGLIGAGLSAAYGRRWGAVRVYGYGLIGCGLLIVGYSRANTGIGAALTLFFAGVASAAATSMIGALIMRSTPHHLLGRVSAVIQPSTTIVSLGATTVAAWLASSVLRDLDRTIAGIHFGPIDTIFLVAGLVIAFAGWWALHARTANARAGETPSRETRLGETPPAGERPAAEPSEGCQ